MDNVIRVLLVDDHPPFRVGMRVLLEQNPAIQVVGEAGTGAEALVAAGQLQPHVLVLDCQLPDMDGPALAAALRAQELPVRILALSAYDDLHYIRGLLAAGVTGYLLKNEAIETIVAAVQAAAQGKAFFSAAVAVQLAQLARLDATVQPPTPREQQVLEQLALGKTNAEIARQLRIGERTVRFHVENLFGRLGVENRVEAVVRAMQAGWLDAP
ncbi:MAG: response regulator transcription factor [Caldilineaceae bacterium]|nr:response regulator transcription factor [Caldilineaceae bacterium]